jgi:hypothetical protein
MEMTSSIKREAIMDAQVPNCISLQENDPGNMTDRSLFRSESVVEKTHPMRSITAIAGIKYLSSFFESILVLYSIMTRVFPIKPMAR